MIRLRRMRRRERITNAFCRDNDFAAIENDDDDDDDGGDGEDRFDAFHMIL